MFIRQIRDICLVYFSISFTSQPKNLPSSLTLNSITAEEPCSSPKGMVVVAVTRVSPF